MAGFNPRARAGRDGGLWTTYIKNDGFNPRARAGRDNSYYGGNQFVDLFQSTRPRGARQRPYSASIV